MRLLFVEDSASIRKPVTKALKASGYAVDSTGDGMEGWQMVQDHDYDVIIANHYDVVNFLRQQFPYKPIISTIHGILHFHEDGKTLAPEHPADAAGVNQFVAVSEEVQKKLLEDYGIESAIIRNFFDIPKYKKLRAPNDKPKQFLINTNYSSKDDAVVVSIREAAKHFGAKVAAVGMNFAQSFDLTRPIEESDVVFGMGRSVLEGVAAGRLGIVHGRWGTGGVICEGNIDEIRERNFSGRNAEDKHIATPEEIIAMIEQYYNPAVLEWGAKYAAREHNAMVAAEEYVRLARELTGELIVRPQKAEGVDPAARPFRLAKDVTET